MYKNYIFDLYGTLIDIETNEYDMDAWNKLAVSLSFYNVTYTPDQLKEAYFACCELQMRNGKKNSPFSRNRCGGYICDVVQKQG